MYSPRQETIDGVLQVQEPPPSREAVPIEQHYYLVVANCRLHASGESSAVAVCWLQHPDAIPRSASLRSVIGVGYISPQADIFRLPAPYRFSPFIPPTMNHGPHSTAFTHSRNRSRTSSPLPTSILLIDTALAVSYTPTPHCF